MSSSSWHHRCFCNLSSVIRSAGLKANIFLNNDMASESNLLHGVSDVYLFSFHAKNSAQFDVGWSHGSSAKSNSTRHIDRSTTLYDDDDKIAF